jgi:hypothetical protein
MYHGTSTIPPEAIYKIENGFDMGYTQPGLWGYAIYFAKNSSYSNKYAYKGKKAIK